MTREQQAISANCDLIERAIRKTAANPDPWGYALAIIPVEQITSLGAAPAVVVNQQARANAGNEFKPEAALTPFARHEQAHETFLMNAFGRCDE